MSLEKEDLRLKMLQDMMERLRLIADVRGHDYAHQAVILLEKAIMGEFHEVSLMLERANKNRKKRERLGLVGHAQQKRSKWRRKRGQLNSSQNYFEIAF